MNIRAQNSKVILQLTYKVNSFDITRSSFTFWLCWQVNELIVILTVQNIIVMSILTASGLVYKYLNEVWKAIYI